MDDEVFVTVKYRLGDFVGARRLALLTRFREANAPQLIVFGVVAAIGVLFFAPDPIGRIIASVIGALIGLIAVLLVLGFVRASRSTPLPMDEATLEVSDAGIVVKASGRYRRIAWRDFEHVARGQGVFFAMGKMAVVIPQRVLRKDQVETLAALVQAHAEEAGSVSGSDRTPPAPAEKNDGHRAERKDDSDR